MGEPRHVYQNRRDGYPLDQMYLCARCNGYYGVPHDGHDHDNLRSDDCACRIHREAQGLSRQGDYGWILGEENMADNADTIRQVDKALDVLKQVEKMMTAEAEMNATKHMADIVRPVPLAGVVSSLVGDFEAWRARLDIE